MSLFLDLLTSKILSLKELNPQNITYVDEDVILTPDYYFILVTSSSTITLPDATLYKNKQYIIKNNGNNINVIIAAASLQSIDNVASISLTQRYQTVTVMSDGNNWFIITKV
jgi:hypothetical protein